MKANRTLRVLSLTALALLACCAAPRAKAHPEGTTWHFGDGGEYVYKVDDQVVIHLEARDGRLFCNDVDTGPYRPGASVRFVSDSEIVVDGETRAVPPAGEHRS